MNQLDSYLTFQCSKGLSKRNLLPITKEYQDRLDYELSVICGMNFSGYFLIVQDVLAWARNQDIYVGPGRGSCGGALIAYLLDITQLDPIKYNLYFERFLNAARISSPDIDMDFEEAERERVIQYLRDKYGTKCIANIGTFGSMKAKAAIRDVTRTLGFDYSIGDKLSSLILPPIEGKPQSLQTCYDNVPELTKYLEDKDSAESIILHWANKLEDRIRSFGTHASGIIIADKPVSNYVPLYLSKDQQPVAQFDMSTVEECGLVKFDFLGLRALTTIKRTIQNIYSRTQTKINILSIPINDQDTFDLFSSGNLDGIFQFEGSGGIKDLVVKAKPSSIEDLAVLNALYRPGPISSGMVATYIKVRNGEQLAEYLIPELESILHKTGSVLVYQEQVLEICKQIAGYSLSEAYIMRKVIGKKVAADMEKQHQKFVDGCVSNGFTRELGQQLFQEIRTFAGYGFNKSHSVLYSYLSYQMAWLKTHYPADFICACLTSDSDEEEKVIRYINYCKEHNIKVLPPDVNESGEAFTVSRDALSIRFGLAAIKNIGKGPIKAILSGREETPYKSLLDFTSREQLSRVNSRQLESLILSGAFDTIEHSRAKALSILEKVWDLRDEHKRYQAKLETYNKRVQQYNEREEEIKQGSKKKSFKMPDKPEEPHLESYGTEEDLSMIDRLKHERELLGFYISGHPLDYVSELHNKKLLTISKLASLYNKKQAFVIAIPTIIKEITTKQKKQKMAFITIEDKTGTIEANVAPVVFEEFGSLLEEGKVLGFKGFVEQINGEDTTITKFRIQSIHEITSQKQERVIEQNIMVPLKELEKISQWIKLHPGDSVIVNLFAKQNNLEVSLGKFSCSEKLNY